MFSKKYLMVSLILITIVAAYLIFVTIKYPYLGLIVEEQQSGEWKISKVNDISWAKQIGIQVGDIVTMINQKPAGEHPTIKKYGILEQADQIELRVNGYELLYHMPKKINSEQLSYFIIIPANILLLIIVFSSFLIRKKSDDSSVPILVLFLISVGISYLSAGGSSLGDSLSRICNDISFLFIPYLFMYFLLNYFHKYDIQMVNPRILLYYSWVNGMLISIDCMFIILDLGPLYPIIRISKLGVFSAGIIICLLTLLFIYIKYRKTVHKPFLKILLIGMLFAFFPFVGLVALPKILFGMEWIPGPLSAVFLFFVPVTFIYLVTAKRLLDIDFIINRMLYYSTIALFPSVIITFIAFTSHDDKHPAIFLIILFVLVHIVFTVFLYMKEMLSFHLRSRLFKEKYNFQASLDQFSNDISKVMKVTDLEERLITEVKDVLAVKSLSLLEIVKKDGSLLLIRGHSDFPSDEIQTRIMETTQTISIGEIIEIEQGVFLYVGEKMDTSYLIWIGEKLNRTRFNLDEKTWLKTITQYVSIVYENLHLIEGLIDDSKELMNKKTNNTAPPWFLRFIFNISEKERSRLALDLHDSVLQDQLYWYRKLEGILANQDLPLDLKNELNNVKEGLLDIFDEIRKTCNDLRPPFLKEIGIVATLSQLFHYAQLHTNFVIHFDSSKLDADLDSEQVIAIYRIVQELLGNATKHSKATRIDIHLTSTNEKIYLNYQDNGIGMNLGDPLNDFKHFGLSGIKERTFSLEGEAEFHSSPYDGMKVAIWIPRIISAS